MDEKTEQWKAVIEKWRESGQTQKEFCRDREIKLSTLHYWMKRVKKLEADEPPVRELVRVSPVIPARSSKEIIIEIDQRYRITVPEGMPTDSLRAVLAAFE